MDSFRRCGFDAIWRSFQLVLSLLPPVWSSRPPQPPVEVPKPKPRVTPLDFSTIRAARPGIPRKRRGEIVFNYPAVIYHPTSAIIYVPSRQAAHHTATVAIRIDPVATRRYISNKLATLIGWTNAWTPFECQINITTDTGTSLILTGCDVKIDGGMPDDVIYITSTDAHELTE